MCRRVFDTYYVYLQLHLLVEMHQDVPFEDYKVNLLGQTRYVVRVVADPSLLPTQPPTRNSKSYFVVGT